MVCGGVGGRFWGSWGSAEFGLQVYSRNRSNAGMRMKDVAAVAPTVLPPSHANAWPNRPPGRALHPSRVMSPCSQIFRLHRLLRQPHTGDKQLRRC